MKQFHLLSLLLLWSTLTVYAQNQIESWNVYTVRDPQQSPAFLDVEDLDGDGFHEILLSTLIELSPPGPPTSLSRGALHLFSNPAKDLNTVWEDRQVVSLTEPVPQPFVNEPQVLDVDGDGIRDIVVHQGFLTTLGGSHYWLKGPDYTERSNFAPESTQGNTFYFWHESDQTDFDGDGLIDLVTTSIQTQDATFVQLEEKNLRVEYYRNLGDGEFDYHLINDSLGGVFIKLYDVDQDNDQDIVVSHFFGPPAKESLAWLENVSAPSAANNFIGEWEHHVIDRTTGLGYRFDFADIDHDGTDELIYCNHNNQDNTNLVDENGAIIPPGLYYFEIPTDPRTSEQWERITINEDFRVNMFDQGNPASQGVPGIYDYGDVNQDGLMDIAIPGDGNDTLYTTYL